MEIEVDVALFDPCGKPRPDGRGVTRYEPLTVTRRCLRKKGSDETPRDGVHAAAVIVRILGEIWKFGVVTVGWEVEETGWDACVWKLGDAARRSKSSVWEKGGREGIDRPTDLLWSTTAMRTCLTHSSLLSYRVSTSLAQSYSRSRSPMYCDQWVAVFLLDNRHRSSPPLIPIVSSPAAITLEA